MAYPFRGGYKGRTQGVAASPCQCADTPAGSALLLSATRSAATPKPNPSVVQSKTCAPIEAIRNCHSTTAGNCSGTSLTTGSATPATTIANQIEGAGDEARIPRAEAGLEPHPHHSRADHRRERQRDHAEIERGTHADRVGIADRWRVGRIFEDGHDIDRDKPRSREQGGGGARRKLAHAAIGERECQSEKPAQGGAVSRYASQQAKAGLDQAADQFGIRPLLGSLRAWVGARVAVSIRISVRLSSLELSLEGDRPVDWRLAGKLQKTETDYAREHANKHAAPQQDADHVSPSA